MKTKLLLLLLLWQGVVFGQENTPDKYLKKLSDQFMTINTSLINENKLLEDIKAKITSSNNDQKVLTELITQLDKTKVLQFKLDSIYTVAQTAISFYDTKGELKKEEAKQSFPHEHQISTASSSTSKDVKTYLYFGKDEVIEEWKPTGNKKYDDIITKFLNKESEAYLGDIIIPKEMQEFQFYKPTKDLAKPFIPDNRIYRFKSISFEVLDGFFTNIKVFIVDQNGSEHLFENKAPVSILNFSSSAPKNFIYYKHPIRQNGIVNFEEIEKLRIRLSDVLMYTSKPGNNFIPNDITFEFPTKDKNGQVINKDSYVKYEIKEDTSLQNAVELRAYTDFLGLFADAPNGIVQLEGKGDFYLFPFKTGNYQSDLRLLDKVSPYVNFSKIDNDVRAVKTITLDNANITPANKLDLIQKSYLEMGAKINLINVRFTKEVPFRLIAYMPLRYQIADVIIKDKFENIQGFAFGGGIKAEAKRFNNFGFNYSFEYSQYNFKDHNSLESFESPNCFGVIRNEAEIFYYPGTEKTQSIFLKLKTFNNLSNDEAFYQLQFGYRFSIGLSNVKNKTN
ncbi:hypothetical protein [Epilithonimonas sp. UC225_85]|uniref:hypothetical protein n=1 Tax=Epilithonimonas sp. UC225_85 TaxID=3350167 RepID=UPI0036D32A5A